MTIPSKEVQALLRDIEHKEGVLSYLDYEDQVVPAYAYPIIRKYITEVMSHHDWYWSCGVDFMHDRAGNIDLVQLKFRVHNCIVYMQFTPEIGDVIIYLKGDELTFETRLNTTTWQPEAWPAQNLDKDPLLVMERALCMIIGKEPPEPPWDEI